MYGFGNGADIVIGQNNSGRRLNVGCENDIRLFGQDGRHYFSDRSRGKGRLRARVHRTRLNHRLFRRNLSHFKNLTPAIAKPAIANHQTVFPSRKLTCHGLHGKGSTSGNDDRRFGVVDLFEGR